MFSYDEGHPFSVDDSIYKSSNTPVFDHLKSDENNMTRSTSKWSNFSRQLSGILVQNFSISVFCNSANSVPLRSQQILQAAIFFKSALQVSHFGVILMAKKLITKWKHLRKGRYSRIFGQTLKFQSVHKSLLPNFKKTDRFGGPWIPASKLKKDRFGGLRIQI